MVHRSPSRQDRLPGQTFGIARDWSLNRFIPSRFHLLRQLQPGFRYAKPCDFVPRTGCFIGLLTAFLSLLTKLVCDAQMLIPAAAGIRGQDWRAPMSPPGSSSNRGVYELNQKVSNRHSQI